MHDLVVAERQDEVLAERVGRSKGEFAVVMRAVDRIAGQVAERVVHPPHVPLEPEPQATDLGRTRHHGPGGRLFGVGVHVGEFVVNTAIELLEERDRTKVLAAAVLVRDPLAALA